MAVVHWTLTRHWLLASRRPWPRAAEARPIDLARFDLLRAIWPTLATAAASGGLFFLVLRVPAVGRVVDHAPGGVLGTVLVVVLYAMLGVLAGAGASLFTFDLAFPLLVGRALLRRARRRSEPGPSAAAAFSACVRDLTPRWEAGEGEARRDRVRRRLEIAATLAEWGAGRGELLERRREVAKVLRDLGLVIASGCDNDDRKHVRRALEGAVRAIESGGWAAARPILERGFAATHVARTRNTRAPVRGTNRVRNAVAAAIGVGATFVVLVAVRLAPLGFDYLNGRLLGRYWSAEVAEAVRSVAIPFVGVVGVALLGSIAARFKDSMPTVAGIIAAVQKGVGAEGSGAERSAADAPALPGAQPAGPAPGSEAQAARPLPQA